MELSGKVIAVLPARSGESARGKWMTQEYVIEYQEGQYPRKLCFSVFGEDRIQRFNIQIGQYVSVAFDIDAREWNGRYFTDIRAYDVRLAEPAGVSATETGPGNDPFPPVHNQPTTNTTETLTSDSGLEANDNSDNLPF